MGMSLGFRVMPGVRVRVSSRGVRTSVGPRAARIHVGGGRTTLSSGLGPMSVSSTSRGRSTVGRRSSGTTPAQLQRHEAAITRAQNADEKLARIGALAAAQHELVSAHLETFSPTQRPVVPDPSWVIPAQYLADFERQYLTGVGRFDRSGRERARQAAVAAAEHAAAQYNAQLAQQHRDTTAQTVAWWDAVVCNEPTSVLALVNDAFADNASPAAALSVDGSELSVLMIQPGPEEFGDQKATLTPSGKPTIKRMTKTEQREQWTSCALSRAIATIAEAFAVAPGITRVHLAVVTSAGTGGAYKLILTGDVVRPSFIDATWPSVITTGVMARGGQFASKTDRFGALDEIPTAGDPQLLALVDGLNGVIDNVAEDDDVETVDAVSEADMPASATSTPTFDAPPEAPVDSPTPTADRRARPTEQQARSNEATQPSWMMPGALDGRPFDLWGSRGNWCNLELKGTQHRQDAILAQLPRRLADGAELDTVGHLVPEPTNPFDPNGVGCHVNGQLIGYLPRGEAARYSSVLTRMVESGQLPTARVHLWAREFDDPDFDDQGGEITNRRYYTTARIALAEPALITPTNLAPPRPRAELPDGAAVKVSGTQDHLQDLLAVLGDRDTCWAYATLEPQTVESVRSTKTVVAVRISGRLIGMLTPQMSTAYLPVVEPLHAAGCHAVGRVLLKGSPVSVAATLYAARAHDINREWFADVARHTGVDLR